MITPEFLSAFLRLILPGVRGKDESFVNGIEIHGKSCADADFSAVDKGVVIHNVLSRCRGGCAGGRVACVVWGVA